MTRISIEAFERQTAAFVAAIGSHPMRLAAGAIYVDASTSSWLAANEATRALGTTTDPEERARLTREVGMHRAREHAVRTAWRERSFAEAHGKASELPHVTAELAPLLPKPSSPPIPAPPAPETRH